MYGYMFVYVLYAVIIYVLLYIVSEAFITYNVCVI